MAETVKQNKTAFQLGSSIDVKPEGQAIIGVFYFLVLTTTIHVYMYSIEKYRFRAIQKLQPMNRPNPNCVYKFACSLCVRV